MTSPKRRLSDYFVSAQTAPPLLSEAEVLAAISGSKGSGTAPLQRLAIFLRNNFLLTGALIMVIMTVVLSLFSIFPAGHNIEAPPPAPAISSQQNRDEKAKGAVQNETGTDRQAATGALASDQRRRSSSTLMYQSGHKASSPELLPDQRVLFSADDVSFIRLTDMYGMKNTT